MLQGRCVDLELSGEFPKTVYLFPNGPLNYYVSRFPNKEAHMGCFQADKFQVAEEWPPEPDAADLPSLEPGKMYSAQFIWKPEKQFTYHILKNRYFILPKANQKNAIFYKDRERKQLGGCFPLHWFTDFQLIEEEALEESFEVELVEEKAANFEQMSLF
ncbi:hypothetical protein [Bacillus sp. PK3_68]|uniref:hypothetical protein n=1 Tax=Bacillus sp. PK3_68 TaxID=2027408 RepID=UPI000E720CC4|nr:hypothetical protein [Bacillus sp. PK3_68]RJS60138.1 hypothetical protein CJ483_08735 [Bacillus sp. PK3_68]